MQIGARDLKGALTSQKIAFKDLVDIYMDPKACGNIVRSTVRDSRTSNMDRRDVQYSSATGEGQRFRILYNITADHKPTNIYIQLRNTAYANGGKRPG